METEYANVHRGLHYLANAATEAYRGGARDRARASSTPAPSRRSSSRARRPRRSTSSRLASAASAIGEGDEIVLSIMEHHSNIVPWHFQRERKGAVIKWAPVDDEGNFLARRLREAALAAHQDRRHHAYVERARHRDADQGDRRASPTRAAFRCWSTAPGRGASAVDVQDLDCDFYVFTGHKVYGPTGIGVLYGKREWLERLPPYQGGGEMIETVTQRHASPTTSRRTASRPARRRSSRRSGSAPRSTT